MEISSSPLSKSHHFPFRVQQSQSLSLLPWIGLGRNNNHHRQRHFPLLSPAPALLDKRPRTLIITAAAAGFPSPFHLPTRTGSFSIKISSANVVAFAGRSKKKPGGPSTGRIEGNAEMRRQARQNARKRSRRLAENFFHRQNNPKSANQADQFTEDELEMIGLGYDRSVRFMEKDDPNLRHPYDWYKYGEYGPYSWRGVVIGRPIRGRFSDERVTLIGEVKDHEEWEKIEQHDMKVDFGARMEVLSSSGIGFRFFWVFVRHPKWKSSELPWQQWTLVSEVAVEAGKNQRLDKWSLMGRLGNKTRALITQCAAWMRPDIIYVHRPVYQCRFEPQDDFFKVLGPMLDPVTEDGYLFELKDENGRIVELCTYFGGLCKIVRISQKAFVDDVVRAYDKLSDLGKSRCLEFLLRNHPLELLHPYTKEWKAKLEEMELGCDAPDDSDDEFGGQEKVITDWIEIDEGEESSEEIDDGGDIEDYEEEEDLVIDVGVKNAVEEEDDEEEEDIEEEEEEEMDMLEKKEYWDKQWREALKDSDKMEKLVKRKVEASSKYYKRQMKEEKRMVEMEKKNKKLEEEMEAEEKEEEEDEDEGSTMMGEMTEEEFYGGQRRRGPKRRIKRSRIPPELFLRAAVRPFTYRSLVKEIVLLRHAILDKEVNPQG